jgi:hypothetical protein
MTAPNKPAAPTPATIVMLSFIKLSSQTILQRRNSYWRTNTPAPAIIPGV